MRGGRRERVPLPGEQRVDRSHPGDPRRHVEDRVELPDRTRDPVEHREEEVDQDEAEPEIGNRPGEHAIAEQQPVEDALAPHRRPDADRNPDHHRPDAGQDDQFQRRRQTLRDIREHALRCPPGGAEIAVRHPVHVNEVLLEQRAIEPQVVTYLGDPVGGRKLAREQVGGIAGQQPDQEKDDHRDDDELRDEKHQAPADIAEKPHLLRRSPQGHAAARMSGAAGTCR